MGCIIDADFLVSSLSCVLFFQVLIGQSLLALDVWIVCHWKNVNGIVGNQGKSDAMLLSIFIGILYTDG